MSEFSDLYVELRMILDDPESFDAKISSQLDPNLADELSAYAAARNESPAQTILSALQLFMFSAAEEAWRELSGEVGPEGDPEAAPLNIILERFMAIALDPSRQRLIEGPESVSILNQFWRIREE